MGYYQVSYVRPIRETPNVPVSYVGKFQNQVTSSHFDQLSQSTQPFREGGGGDGVESLETFLGGGQLTTPCRG